MAEFAVGNGLSADMSNFDFSVLFFGTAVVATKKRYVLEFDSGEVSDFRGSGFGYNKRGEPTRGELEGFSFFSGGAQVLKIGGVDVAVKDFVAAAETSSKSDDLKIMSVMFSGKDTIMGGELADGLMGFKGKDTIVGGGGADFLAGGSGGDRFVFATVEDTVVGSGDTIIDFKQSQGDRVDLSFMTDAAFVGNSGTFSGTRAEVAFLHNDGKTVIYVDADGNGSADAEINLRSVINLTAADFIL